ncbi:Histone deacetylase domain containing protein, putative [Angomonas deanei]|uniref:Histone deacetylase domain containing protein, putative n=1 Tax=Angomonas deanei TaxID=59799 RepID=A0A7G2CH55_9TRYP|nr:Histone deacetylase domain containing protein, putative [Angomonas deanei]
MAPPKPEETQAQDPPKVVEAEATDPTERSTRRRAPVDYASLEKQLDITDDDVLAMFGARASSSSSSSSSSGSSTREGASHRGLGAVHNPGDTPGLSLDSWTPVEEEEPYYPGTGHLERLGGDDCEAARGRNINIPWPCHGFGDLEYLRVVHEIVIPAGKEFQPDLVLISCGFDSARGDLLGSMMVTASGYYAMTTALCQAFHKVVAVLEGGYHVGNVAKCSEAVLRALLEQSGTDGVPRGRVLWHQTGDLIEEVKQTHAQFFSCFQ